MLRGRGAAQAAHEDSGFPRRPARHRHHRGGGGAERAVSHRQADRGGQDRRLGSRRGRARLPQSSGEVRGGTREYLGHRSRRRGLSGPPQAHGPLERGLCAKDRQAAAQRGDRGRGYLSGALRSRRAQARDGEAHGAAPLDPGARQSDSRDHARGRVAGAARRAVLQRALGLPEPGQQCPVFPLYLPRRARRRRHQHQRGNEARRGRRDRGARARAAVGGRGPRL